MSSECRSVSCLLCHVSSSKEEAMWLCLMDTQSKQKVLLFLLAVIVTSVTLWLTLDRNQSLRKLDPRPQARGPVGPKLLKPAHVANKTDRTKSLEFCLAE